MGGPSNRAASLRCHRRAIEILSDLPVAENPDYLADLGAAWVNLGCALQAGDGRESLHEALGASDRAIEFLGRLPIGAHPRFRHNLAAAWMGRADVLARIDAASGRAEALCSYGRAIEIARDLPLDEKASFRILFASCWINRGNLLQAMGGAEALSAAVGSYDAALAALGNLPQSGHRLAGHRSATAWTNRGEAHLRLAQCDSAGKAAHSARMALAQIEGGGPEMPASAERGLGALRVLARALESLPSGANRVAELTDIAEQGVELALGFRDRATDLFDPLVAWFFSFGCRVYGRWQPQFLAEFIDDVLRRLDSRPGPAFGMELRAIARRALAGTLEGLCGNRLIVGGSPQTERLLRTVGELRAAAARLDA